jgi:predicted Rossmann fold nucleotide-binding protein DprA/Smf involved in DNA uptake
VSGRTWELTLRSLRGLEVNCAIVPSTIGAFLENSFDRHVLLVALYLRGGPLSGATRRRWVDVDQVLRTANVGVDDAAEALRDGGLWEEACIVNTPIQMDWASRVAHQAVSPELESYPRRWTDRLGRSAPPAAWFRTGPPKGARTRPLVGVVGSRHVGDEIGDFAEEVGREIVRLGFDLVSGGAAGCDRLALRAALNSGRPALNILPEGLARALPTGSDDLSVCAPLDSFSIGAAMERNALIYAAAEATVVVHARLRAGGGWHGATAALRRRLGPVIVREDPSSPAHRALISLGARPLASPSALGAVLAERGSRTEQASLFG